MQLPAEYQVVNVRSAGRYVYLTLGGVHSSEVASTLRHAEIQVPEKERYPLPEGYFYQDDIIGLSVFTEAGRYLGKITEIMETGGNDVYVATGMGETYDIPALASAIKDIDLAQQRMVLFPIPGWIE